MTDLADRTVAPLAELADLGSRIEAEVRRVRKAALDEARGWANDIGIRDARESVPRALDAFHAAQLAYRTAQAAEQAAQDAYDKAVSEAEWMLGDSFVVESNKTYLVIANGESEPVKRQMTADEKRAWITNEALRQPGVPALAGELRKAKDATATARDEITHSELRVKAASGDRDAAAAELLFLAAALPRKEIA